MSGINFVVFFIVAYVIYPSQPQVGAPADALVAFYTGDRTRILIAAVVELLDIVMHPLPLLLIGCESSRQGC